MRTGNTEQTINNSGLTPFIEIHFGKIIFLGKIVMV